MVYDRQISGWSGALQTDQIRTAVRPVSQFLYPDGDRAGQVLCHLPPVQLLQRLISKIENDGVRGVDALCRAERTAGPLKI